MITFRQWYKRAELAALGGGADITPEPAKIAWDDLPDDVQQAILRLERKRLWRESLQQELEIDDPFDDAPFEKENNV